MGQTNSLPSPRSQATNWFFLFLTYQSQPFWTHSPSAIKMRIFLTAVNSSSHSSSSDLEQYFLPIFRINTNQFLKSNLLVLHPEPLPSFWIPKPTFSFGRLQPPSAALDLFPESKKSQNSRGKQKKTWKQRKTVVFPFKYLRKSRPFLVFPLKNQPPESASMMDCRVNSAMVTVQHCGGSVLGASGGQRGEMFPGWNGEVERFFWVPTTYIIGLYFEKREKVSRF